MFTREQQERAVAAAQFQQQVAQGVEEIYKAFPTLMRCDANARQIVDLCREFMGEDIAPDLDTFKNLIGLNPDVMESLAHRTVEVNRRQLIEDILALLASKNEGRDGKFDSFNLRSEEKRMASWSVDALRARLHEIRVKQKMVTFPASDLKAYVADARRVVTESPGWPTLPPTIWNGTSHVKVDAEYLNGLARTDLWSFKRLCRLYGSQQVDHRRGIR